MTNTVPLHHAIRPRGNRDDAGENGEILHQMADILENLEDTTMVLHDASYADIGVWLRGLTIPGHEEIQVAAVDILMAARQPSSVR